MLPMVNKKIEKAEHESDDDLIARIAAHDVQAAHKLLKRHLNFVLRVCQQKLGDREQAEDAAQEVFLAVWSKASTWQPGRAKVTTWLYRIAINKSIDSLRKRQNSLDIDDYNHLASDEPDADHILSISDDKRIIATALKSLSQQHREAIQLFYFEHKKQDMAAADMGLTVSAFESVLRRARQALHTELARQRPHLSII